MIKDLEGKDSNGILADWDHAAMVDGSPYQNFRTVSDLYSIYTATHAKLTFCRVLGSSSLLGF